MVAQAELATAQEQLDAKQQELDAVQVTHSGTLTFTVSVVMPTIKQKNFTMFFTLSPDSKARVCTYSVKPHSCV